MRVIQEIQFLAKRDGAFHNFFIYGYDLQDRQKNGWYIKNIIMLGAEECSIVWEKLSV